MIEYKPVAVVGGDLRQAQIANRLAARGERVMALMLEKNSALLERLNVGGDICEKISQCGTVILPLPLTSDDICLHAPFSRERLTLESCFSSIKPGADVFAGKISGAAKKIAERCGVKLTDYLECEELAILNAAITAEGAVSIAIEEMATALFDANILVTGYGRIARALLRVLSGFGAKITVAARKHCALAEARAAGFEIVPISRLEQSAASADVIFNTVPVRLFDRAMLEKLRSGALLIDLASKPGGVAMDDARELGIKTIWALSLPGKSAPISAGNIILEAIDHCLEEKEALK